MKTIIVTPAIVVANGISFRSKQTDLTLTEIA
jgi:hypothetical protein